MPTVDADCHVIETALTWEYFDPSEAHFRAQAPVRDRDATDARQDPTVKQMLSGSVQTTPATRTMRDIPGRLKHMDDLGVDIQVLYPTLFLQQITDDPEVEAALCRSYNRWLASIWKESGGRLRWAANLPLLNIEGALEQAKYCKANGACRVFMRGYEGERILSDPYFFPIYEQAQSLDLAICVHAGSANPRYRKLVANERFSENRLPIISAFHSLVYHQVPDQFPRLRWGFIEVTALWLPYVLADLKRRLERDEKPPLAASPLKDNRMYVGIQSDDDLPYIVGLVGEDNLVVGSDYGHGDPAAEIEAVRNLPKYGRMSPEATRKIMQDNPAALYGL